jgi:hypothetical protein
MRDGRKEAGGLGMNRGKVDVRTVEPDGKFLAGGNHNFVGRHIPPSSIEIVSVGSDDMPACQDTVRV